MLLNAVLFIASLWIMLLLQSIWTEAKNYTHSWIEIQS
jgi:hypothetical protein